MPILFPALKFTKRKIHFCNVVNQYSPNLSEFCMLTISPCVHFLFLFIFVLFFCYKIIHCFQLLLMTVMVVVIVIIVVIIVIIIAIIAVVVAVTIVVII